MSGWILKPRNPNENKARGTEAETNVHTGRERLDQGSWRREDARRGLGAKWKGTMHARSQRSTEDGEEFEEEQSNSTPPSNHWPEHE